MDDRRPLKANYRPDRTNLAKFVANLPRPVGRFGLTHVTTGYFAREIVDAGAIVPAGDCPIFKEPLVYAFYGRSAFRNRKDDETSNLHFVFPVLLILDPATVPKPKYLFGFDSGAFVKRFLDEFLEDHMPLFDFLVEADVDSAAALAAYFFGDGKRYLKNQPLDAVDMPASNYEGASYSRMVKAAGQSNSLDDRTSTPELIFGQAVPLAGVVRAAILPDLLAGDPEIGGKLRADGIVTQEYEWRPGSRPAEYHMLIRTMVESLYDRFGWGHA